MPRRTDADDLSFLRGDV